MAARQTTSLAPTEVPTTEPASDPTVQYGTTGTVNFRGFLQSAEYNRKLLPPNSFAVYDQMAKSDPTVHATMQHITTPILAADWEVRPANDSDEALEHAAFVNLNMFETLRRPWVSVQEDGLKYLRYGFAILEGTFRADREAFHYTRRDGTVVQVPERDVLVWDNWAPRLPPTITRWLTHEDKLLAVEQMAYNSDTGQLQRVIIPREKFLILVNEMEGDDYNGVSLLRGAYKPWYLLENIQRVAAIGMERFLVGTPMARMRSNATDTQVSETMTALMNIRSGDQTALVYKADDGIDCDKETDTGRAIWILSPDREPPDALPLIRHLESNIFTNIMARFMDLGQKETGARATAEVQRDPFFLGLVGVATKIAEAWNRGPVKQLIDLNYPGVKEYPKIHVSGITPQDIPVIARAAAMWAANGFLLPDPELEQWIRDQMGLPDKVTTAEDMAKYAMSPPAQSRQNGPGSAAGGSHDTGQGLGNLAGGDGQREGGDDSDTPRLADIAWAPWRSFRPSERFTDWHGASRIIDASRDDFAMRVSAPLAHIADRLVDDAYNAFESADPKRVAKLSARDLGPLAEAIRGAIGAASLAGADSMRTELNRQAAGMPLYDDQSIIAAPGYTLDDPDWLRRAKEAGIDAGLIRARAEAIVASLIATLEGWAKKLALGFLRRRKFDRLKMMTDLEREMSAAARKEALLVASEAFNTGRAAIMHEVAKRILSVEYSAMLDKNTCGACRAADGRVTEYGSPTFMLLDPPNQACSGGDRCRCVWVPMLGPE